MKKETLMKRIFVIITLFAMSIMSALAANIGDDNAASIDKSVIGVNKEQLEQREVRDTDITIDSRNAYIDASSTEGFEAESEVVTDKIRVTQHDEVDIDTKSSKKGGGILAVLIGIAGVAALAACL